MRTGGRHKIMLAVLLGGACLLAAAPVGAADGSILTELQNQVKSASSGWQTTVMDAARSLFWLLATIEIAIAAIWLAIQSPAIEAWFGELVRRIMLIGFFAFVLEKGPVFAKAVVDSLFQIGAGSGSASPADVFNAGITVAARLSRNAQFGLFENNVLGIATVFAMLVVVISFALVSAIFVSVMVEMYVGLLAGMIMLGLGGSSFTKDFAVRYLVYAFSVGLKLMGLVMIAKIGSTVLIGLVSSSSTDDQLLATLTIAGISIVIFMICVYVPPILQGVVQGASVSSGMETFRSAAQLGSFAASTAGGIIGSGQLAAGTKGVYDAAKNEGAASPTAASKAALAGFGALASGAADKLTGAQGSYGASVLGLANAKLKSNASTSADRSK